MPGWVPFLPWLALPYLLQVAVSYFLVLAVRDRARRRACLSAYFATFAVISLVWLLYPTVMNRPAVPDGWWNWPYQVMSSVDLPVNILPAGHIVMPVIICWGFLLDRPRWLGEPGSVIPRGTPQGHRPASFGVASPACFGAARYFAYQSSTRW